MKTLYGYAVIPVRPSLPELWLCAGQDAAKQEVLKRYQEGRAACIWRLGQTARVEWLYCGQWVTSFGH
jgi:hypothetical protein